MKHNKAAANDNWIDYLIPVALVKGISGPHFHDTVVPSHKMMDGAKKIEVAQIHASTFLG